MLGSAPSTRPAPPPPACHPGLTHVDQVRSVTATNAVKVDLCAGAAGALVTHLPEVVLAAKGQHALGGQEAQPDGLGLVVGRQALLGIATEVGGIQALRWQIVHLRAKHMPGSHVRS